MINRLLNRGLNAELIATFLFMVLSSFYIITTYGLDRLFDSLFLWMFPASVMIFLTLLIARIIERASENKTKKQHYVDWRK